MSLVGATVRTSTPAAWRGCATMPTWGPSRVSRSTTIAADPALVHGLVNDFHEWTAWSPWEGVDDDLERTYSGADSGVGAHYAWRGNRKAGEGSMEIVATTPEQIDLVLTFLKPYKATNDVVVPHRAGARRGRRDLGDDREPDRA